MKPFGFLCLCFFLVIWAAALVYHGCSSTSNPGTVSTGRSTAATLVVKSRKLKDNINTTGKVQEEDAGHMTLEDYRPIDPVPSSKANIRPRPIQHGTPLMPYIPRPSPPPGKPNHGG